MMGRSRIVPGDGDRRHGTTNGYANLSCRCRECTSAHSKLCAGLRAKRAGELDDDDERHGKPSTYRNHGCRCEACTAANSKDVADRRAKRKVNS